jgi:glutamate-ammonia-ligase adenylyltransferase
VATQLDPTAMLERLHALEPSSRATWVAELADPLRTTFERLLAGPDPSGAIQRALSLPASLLAEPLPAAMIELLHQGSYPARLMRLLDAPTVAAVLADQVAPEPGLPAQLEQAIARHGAAEGIARVRTRAYLRLARRELEHAPLEEVGAALSDLAGACIDAAMSAVDAKLPEQVGVFGMGKLGGRELNFLSDIDLVFVHADEVTEAADENQAHRLRTRLHDQLRRVLRLLEGNGVWRPLFHVDLRLRPFGSRGPLSISVSALERYYERHGRGWERQAWLRAHPVAGNRSLGAEVLRRIEPFVWPRSLGPSVFEDIAAMMKRSRAQAHRTLGGAAIDLKHDGGGIREIEFFVQSLQLLNGGRHPSVRSRSTLGTLDRLAAAGFVSDREHEILARAYRTLRRIEHRVQLAEGQQTHRVPSSEADRELLARRLAIAAPPTWLIGEERRLGEREPTPPATLETFDSALAELRGQVQAITGTLTGESELAGSQAADREVAQAVILDPASSPRSRLDALALLGLWPEAAEEIAAMLDHLLSREHGPLASSGAALRGAQRLLLACLDSANPTEAVRRLVEFTATRPAYLAVWRLMAEPEQEQVVRQVADLFGTSEPLSRGLIGFADQPSSVGDGGLALLLEAQAAELPHADELRERFTGFRAEDPDARLDERLLMFKHRELVRIGLYDLGRRPDPLAVGRSLSDLAELVVRELLVDIGREHADAFRTAGDAPAVPPGSRRGPPISPLHASHAWGPPGFSLAVLSLGKFGMQAMDYGSDLDLMFVFDPDPDVEPTAVLEQAQRVSRRLLARLEDRAHGLRLYEVDMRLRPSGRQGLLVSSLAGFRSYHSRPLEVWERLALIRLRGVAELRFGRELDPTAQPGSLSATVIDEVVASSVWAPTEPQQIASDTRALKQRIEQELARETREQWDVKTGVGGTLELELLVAALQLQHDVRTRDIPTALERLRERGLLGAAERAELDGAYRFERLLLNRLRMTRASGWGESDRLTLNSPRLTALARRMGLADRDALVATLEHQRAVVRAAFDRHLPCDHAHVGDH